jgi:hypothetical protein
MVETDIGYALIVFALLNLLDWVTTHYALTKLGMRELNPIARKIYERLGSPGLYSWKQIGVGLIVLSSALSMGWDVEFSIWVYNALFAFVVLWNSVQIARRIWELGRGGTRAT